MYSVIIPTLWKSNLVFFRNTLVELETNQLVDEIILIDNDPNFTELSKEQVLKGLKKLKHLRMDTNLYVNPSWNLGASLANSDFLVFLNDDVWTIPSISLALFEHSQHPDKAGAFGLATECFVNAGKCNLDDLSSIKIVKGMGRGEGWGCLFFIRKEDWVPIPEELKIWCGDDFSVSTALKEGRSVYLFYNFIIPEYQNTAKMGKFESIKSNDLEIFLNNFKIK